MSAPYFSVCVPQYNRAAFLIESLRSLQRQSFQDFEVCISDGGSDAAELADLEAFLVTSRLRYELRKSSRNLRYDENLRTAIAMSTGRYILLMGNDDALFSASTLRNLKAHLDKFQPAVAITNYHEISTGIFYRRMTCTAVLGAGPDVAAKTFRHYAFVSGIVLQGDAARRVSHAVCYGSEMYQMYIGTRLIAEGGQFLSIDEHCIDKDLQIPGKTVDSYARKPMLPRWPIVERKLPLGQIINTIATGLQNIDVRTTNRILRSVLHQLYIFTYPYWIFEYRRVQSYSYAIGVYMALRPSVTLRETRLPSTVRLGAWALYLLPASIAFVVPLRLFDAARPLLYRIAKR